jgi:hypothetical protein
MNTDFFENFDGADGTGTSAKEVDAGTSAKEIDAQGDVPQGDVDVPQGDVDVPRHVDVASPTSAHVRAKQVDAQVGGKQADAEAVQGLPAVGSLAYTQTGVVSPRYRSAHKNDGLGVTGQSADESPPAAPASPPRSSYSKYAIVDDVSVRPRLEVRVVYCLV